MKKLLCIILILVCFGRADAVTSKFRGVVVSGSAVGDGLIGHATRDSNQTINANRAWHTPHTPDTPGNVQYGHIWIEDGDGFTFYVGLYDNGGNPLLCCTVVGTDATPAWYNCDAGSAFNVQGGTTYYAGVAQSGGAPEVGRDTAGGDGLFYDATGITPSCVETFDPEETTSGAGNSLTIVWNNAAGDP
ncbi:MAG TPA: hypothetical protein ENH62_14835 [Marinobacter sp.]|uniref:Uncharacterized protein n=1 Tax=marine sediment metagenome TaxID=412755 RepID=A0A0F9NY25_9ZZZZ|nr:hypothetical protein [Marinobacter sp.]